MGVDADLEEGEFRAVVNSTPEDWSRYWQNRVITSFGNVFPSNYDGSILEFWKEHLTGDFDEVVDVACGNGALTWIADELLNGSADKTLITGVDSATIDPFGVLGRRPGDYSEIRFLGNTPAEDLPFADDSIDLVISQFGVEYTDLDRSIPEIGRILKSSGRMVFLLHDKESLIVRNAVLQLEDVESVLDLALDDHLLRLHELGRRLGTPEDRERSEDFRSLASKIDQLVDQVRKIVLDYTEPSPIHLYMSELTSVFNESRRDPQAEILAARKRLASQYRRISHMQSAALSAEGLAHLIELIERTGLIVDETSALAYLEEPNIGTTLTASKRRAAGSRGANLPQ